VNSCRDTAQFYREQSLCGHHPNYEAILAAGYRKFLREGMVCADVGVSLGEHLRGMSAMVGPFGKVVGFEPIRKFAEMARRKSPLAEVHEVALSWETPLEARELHVHRENPGESGLRVREGREPDEVHQVRVSRLDDLWPGNRTLDYIKVDTEGHDLQVLLGAAEVIRWQRPMVSVEWSAATYGLHGHNCMSLWNWAHLMGYRIGDLWGNIVEDRAEWLEVCDVSYWDYWLVPAERVDWWRGLWD